jgi:integrase
MVSRRKKGDDEVRGLSDIYAGRGRTKFRETFAPAIRTGANPTGPQARKDKTGITVKDLFETYVEDLRSANAASTREVERILLGAKGDGGAAKAIGSSKLANAIRVDDITPHLEEIYDRGSARMADMTRSYIGSAYAFAMKSRGNYTNRAAAARWGITVNPIVGTFRDRNAQMPGQRYLQPGEFRAFRNWTLTRDKTTNAAPAARLLLATGQGVTEIMRITEAGYDSAESMVEWAKTKNDRAHAIPLPKQAVEILDALPINAHGLFFPSRFDPKAPLTHRVVLSIINEYVEETGAARFVARDIRRTWKTLGVQAGISKEDRDRIQNHAQTDVGTKHYDRWDYMREKRAAMAVWETFLDRVLAGEFDEGTTHLTAIGPAQTLRAAA